MSTGRTNRNKGHRFERKVAKMLRKLGFEACVTSRSESRNLDNAGVDLCYTDPFYFQCKNTNNQPNFRTILKEMHPEDFTHYKVVLHHTNNKADIAVMYMEDLFEIIQMLKTDKIL